MDANRYFEEMHRAMSAQKIDYSLILSVKVQDLGGADAYLELRRSASGHARVFYSTMGRQNFNFQLFRKGWQLCHNASGELTGRFPTKAEALLDTADFSACIRDDAFDAARTDFIVAQLRRLSDASCPALPQSAREGAMITVDSFVGRGGHWCYWSTQAADCLPIAAILCWLGDFLAGTERRTLQSSPEAMALAARWQAELASPFAQPADCAQRPARTVSPSAPRRAAQQVPDAQPRRNLDRKQKTNGCDAPECRKQPVRQLVFQRQPQREDQENQRASAKACRLHTLHASCASTSARSRASSSLDSERSDKIDANSSSAEPPKTLSTSESASSFCACCFVICAWQMKFGSRRSIAPFSMHFLMTV